MSRRVVVVEDDEDLRESMAELLELEGYEVDTAGDGRVALDVLQQDERLPCVILLDLMMPVMNGWEVQRELRRSPRLSQVPVVVVSGAADLEHAPRDQERLVKPVDYGRLIETVRRHCGCGR